MHQGLQSEDAQLWAAVEGRAVACASQRAAGLHDHSQGAAGREGLQALLQEHTHVAARLSTAQVLANP